MHEYLFAPELVRFAFILGVVVSVVIYDRLRITTGSLVVPGFLGLFLLEPAVLAVTFANAAIGYVAVYRVLPRFAVVYGRARFLLVAAISVGLQVVLLHVGREFELGTLSGPLVGIGFVIPALLANDFGRQGIRPTLMAAAGGGLIVGLVILVIRLIAPELADGGPGPEYGRVAFGVSWLPLAVLASAVAGVGLQSAYGFRSGGLIGAGYVALIVPGWQEVAVLVVCAVVTCLVVTVAIRKRTVLFGRRKFAAMLIVGGLVSWIAYPLCARIPGLQVDALATLPLTGALLTGLFANDLERSGPLRLGAGTALATLFALAVTLLTREIVEARDPLALTALIGLLAVVLALILGGLALRQRSRPERRGAVAAYPRTSASTPMATNTSAR
ncbi:MAG: poly-gamma-glutamate biosynthesis protein PgsC/CapC [Tepidiformaceae bacterium]